MTRAAHDAKRAPTDVLIVGGGPAGSAAATLLARWGHAITLITRPEGSLVELGESIPPSTRKLFDLIGVSRGIESAGFVRSTGNTVWWGRRAPRLESFPNGTCGWQVTSTKLETVLHGTAAAAGVRIVRERFDVSGLDRRQARFVLDCSGRAGLIARYRGLRRPDPEHRTVAIVARWTARAFDVPDPSHTLIESYEGGWAWSVPAPSGERFVAVMVDPRTSSLARNAPAHDIYLGEIARTEHFQRLLSAASLVDGPRGWDASMYDAEHFVDDDVLLVGDAGSFLDPLSSAGVKKALASGWLAAVAVHTSLVNPAMRDTALNFFESRERAVYRAFRAMAEDFFRQAAAGHAHPFWLDRAFDVDESKDEAAIARAFERVRSTTALRLAANPLARVEPRASVQGIEIVLEPRLVRDDRPAGVRYAFTVDLLGLVELASRSGSVPEAFDAYNRRHTAVPLHDFLGALATAIADEWLVWCDT